MPKGTRKDTPKTLQGRTTIGGLMSDGNGNRQWTIWTAGIVVSLIMAILLFVGKGVVANNENSLSRDYDLTKRVTANEIRINRLEECQIYIKDELRSQSVKLDKILNKVQ